MADMRKAAMSNTNLKSMSSATTSGRNSGATTPTRPMEKTDSIINLTKPSLYGIYNDNSVLNLNKDIEDTEIDITIRKVSDSSNSPTSGDLSNPLNRPHNLFRLPIGVKILILAACAFIYNEITKHINYNHFNGNNLASFPLTITNVFIFSLFEKFKFGRYIKIDSVAGEATEELVALALQGCFMGLIVPALDKILPSAFSKRLLSSNPTPGQGRSYSNIFNDIVRSAITFLGISYAIRKIEWTSFLQVSIVWSLLNPGLWLLLDGTISGFLASLVVSFIACATVYFENYAFVTQYQTFENEESIALGLWIGSFLFCGIIIFGKIGRGLFRC